MSTFEEAIGTILTHEGGYVNHPSDPGGETNFGISKRSYPEEDIANLTQQRAAEIYESDWWNRYGYARINSQRIATKVFDLSVNMGSKWGHRILQRAVRAAKGHTLVEDGILGPVSIASINACNPYMLHAALRSEAAGYYRSLGKAEFIKGWLNRAYS